MELQQFGKKAHAFAFRPPEQDARINILTGAIRSSKTISMIPKIFAACASKTHGQKLIAGVSKGTIRNNCLNDIFDIVGRNNYTYNMQSGDLTIFGSKFLVCGAKDEGSEKFIRGLTLSWAYVDEAVMVPESFWMQLLGRLSPKGSRLFATTNPGSPTSYLYKNFINDQEKIRSGDVWTETWTLDDNPTLDPEWVASIKRNYKGIYYDRMILGRWTAAEGAIYKDSYSEDLTYTESEKPMGLRNPGGCVERIVPIDYGTKNDFVALDIYDDGRIWWVDDEYRWDSEKEHRQKTDGEYASDIESFIGPQRNAVVVIDPSAASFKVELLAKNIYHIDAENDVLNGIMTTSSVMARQLIRFNRDRCSRLIEEIQGYAWNEKAADRGVEEPIKANDHGADALRYGIFTKFNQWRLTAPLLLQRAMPSGARASGMSMS